MKTKVLDNTKILKICNRFAFQIIENCNNDNKINVIGIKEKGFEIATLVVDNLNKISKKKIILNYITLNKKNFEKEVHSDLEESNLSSNIFLVDDVLNTGKTLMYSLNHLLKFDVKSVKTLVLIDRNHKMFPVKVDFKGISLSTNIDENVKLINENKSLEAFLL